jgi:hypothetical protein
MSLPDSPLVRTDALDRRIEPVVVATSLFAALCCPMWIGDETGPLLRTLLSLGSVGLLWQAWRFTGWFGGARCVRRAVWSPDGFWQLEFADGNTVEARLSSATRHVGPLVLLAWRTDRGRSYAIVSGGQRGRVEFRRLVARLGLEGNEGRVPGAATGPVA